MSGFGRHDRAGFRREPFVEDFLETSAGPVPRVRTSLSRRDALGGALARLGITRDHYVVTPGLYCVGHPDSQSPVLVTANYKLSFDALRKELGRLDAWLLVVDTHGVNVWCAAGKGLFSTEVVARGVAASALERVVSHRTLVLPQLAATGVAAHKLRGLCGFGAKFGPVQASDIPAWLDGGTGDEVHRVTFTMAQRAVLAPIELVLLWKALAWFALAGFLLSGVGPEVFSLGAAWHRGLWALAATLAGALAGTLSVPVLLPWLPGRAFSLKGACAGGVAGMAVALASGSGLAGGAGLALWSTALGSYLGMNFTGSTPFTSPSGVEYEMRRAIPAQALAVLVAMVAWISAAWAA